MPRPRPLGRAFWPVVVVLLAAGAYGLLRQQRSGLVDFAVPRTAAIRAIHAEPLYRPEDGHYQYKYLPAFAFVMVPFALLPNEAGEVLWFALTVAMAWWFVRLSIHALPERRTAVPTLVWITLLLSGKFLVKELAFGQFNLPLGLLLVGALLSVQQRRDARAGGLAGAGLFVKPYALVLAPWLVITRGWRPAAALGGVATAGLLVPVVTYGWSGNIALLHEWWRTVTDTTAPNLLGHENISFASMWAKWIGPAPAVPALAAATSVAAFGAGLAMLLNRRTVREPAYLEAAYWFLLIPLLSPQGWDYVLLLALPAFLCIVDRWRALPAIWRATAACGFGLTSFTIFDLLRRTLYTEVMQLAGPSIGALLLGAVVLRLRWQSSA